MKDWWSCVMKDSLVSNALFLNSLDFIINHWFLNLTKLRLYISLKKKSCMIFLFLWKGTVYSPSTVKHLQITHASCFDACKRPLFMCGHFLLYCKDYHGIIDCGGVMSKFNMCSRILEYQVWKRDVSDVIVKGGADHTVWGTR